MDRHTAAPALRRSRHRLVAALVVALLVPAGVSTATGAPAPAARPETPAASPPAAARTPAAANPLAGHRLGVYHGPAERSWQPYVEATGARKQLLAKIALRPKATWFGDWIPTADIAAETCETRQETRCVTLGIPPTTAVASTRWPLSPVSRRRAAAHVDAYLWFGRPWLRN